MGPYEVSRLREVETRSISAENPDGSRGGGARATTGTGADAARDLGRGWKVSPSVEIAAGTEFALATISGSGVITHIWLTTQRDHWRNLILRAWWDDSEEPAIEVPVGDFFCQGWGRYAQVSSAVIAVNPNGGFNSYWPMPFADNARISIENRADRAAVVYYQITYELGTDTRELGYLHAQFRRSNPVQREQTHTILDRIDGHGHYVGTYLAWGVNSPGWWGEGEIKFYLDGDRDFPTIAGTGTEDYFGGAWNFDVPSRGYTEFSTPYLGMPQVLRPDGLYASQQRFGLYRWHLMDPVCFARDLRVDIQDLGWRPDGRYRLRSDDVASTCWFYLDRPAATQPELPSVEALEVDGRPPT
jgi:Protein of unknown function (DUF2961)